MEKSREPRLVAAAVLAATTLGVFGVFRDYGPESAVRRFHHGVASGDRAEIAQVVTQGVDTSAVRDLQNFVSQVLRQGQNYQIVTQNRTDVQVDMLAVYGSQRIVWVVVKPRDSDRWRVDPYLTLQGLQKLGDWGESSR